ncbi:hypothetical protein ACSQ67_013501 [Phaseolus vulgaris]
MSKGAPHPFLTCQNNGATIISTPHLLAKLIRNGSEQDGTGENTREAPELTGLPYKLSLKFSHENMSHSQHHNVRTSLGHREKHLEVTLEKKLVTWMRVFIGNPGRD